MTVAALVFSRQEVVDLVTQVFDSVAAGITISPSR
jgi:hypothetical protein